MAVWIDETGLLPQRRRTALEHLRGFLLDDLPDAVQVSLVSYDGNARIRQPFTADREELAAELDLLAEAGASASRVSEEQFLIRRIQNSSRGSATMSSDDVAAFASALQGEVESFAAQAHQRAQHSLANLGGFIEALGVLPGQKMVLVVSDAINPRPGERLFAELQRILGRSAGLDGISAMNFGRRYDLSRDFRQLLRRANTSRVTFMTLSAITERNLGFISAESLGATASDMDQMMVEEQALMTMAGVTGGKVLENSQALGTQLERVAEEVAAYYSVGYIPPTPSDGEYHRLEIKVRQDGVQVRHREGYIGSGTAGDLVDKTVAAAMLGVAENPLGISIEVRAPGERDDGTFLVPVLVRVPIGELVLVPGMESHAGNISLVVVVRSGDGGMSQPEVREYPVVVPNEQLVQATSSSAGYTIGMVMRPGPHRISVGVQDELARIAATTVASIDVGSGE
jgi:VWFA-related protein